MQACLLQPLQDLVFPALTLGIFQSQSLGQYLSSAGSQSEKGKEGGRRLEQLTLVLGLLANNIVSPSVRTNQSLTNSASQLSTGFQYTGAGCCVVNLHELELKKVPTLASSAPIFNSSNPPISSDMLSSLAAQGLDIEEDPFVPDFIPEDVEQNEQIKMKTREMMVEET